MANPTKAQLAERDEARAKLRELVKPGDTVHTILRHVSRSGMQRSISVILAGGDGPYDATWLVARALRMPIDPNHYGVKVGGCGMDMGFHLVYSLSYALWPEGHGCTGPGCPSNDHTNGDRDYTPHPVREHWHRDGGYALRQRWL